MINSEILPEKNQALSVVFSNLSKASEKQLRLTEKDLLDQLAESYWTKLGQTGSLEGLVQLMSNDLGTEYPEIEKSAAAAQDRGVLRALRWGQKVTTLQKTLINRFLENGDSLFEGKNLFVCEACGFVSLGTDIPEICPVCKAPKKRFSKVN